MTNPDRSTRTLATFAYRGFFGCSLVCAALAVAFFVIGLGDGSVSSFNLTLWLLLLAGLAAVLWTGHLLRRHGRTGAAIAVLGVVAVPGLLAGLFALLVIVTQPRWN